MRKLEKALNKAIEGAVAVVEKIANEINDDEGWTTDQLKDLEKAVSITAKLIDSCEKLGIASSGGDPLKDFIALRKKQKSKVKKKPVKPKPKKAAATKKKPAKKKVRKCAKKNS